MRDARGSLAAEPRHPGSGERLRELHQVDLGVRTERKPVGITFAQQEGRPAAADARLQP